MQLPYSVYVNGRYFRGCQTEEIAINLAKALNSITSNHAIVMVVEESRKIVWSNTEVAADA